jgi:hypothetical protein
MPLKPFKYNGQTLRVTGTFRTGQWPKEQWFHSIKNEDTGEFKDKPDEWLREVMKRIKQQ